MSVSIRPLREGEHADCERILRSLPDWFGIGDSIVGYVRDIQVMATWVGESDGEIVGVLTVRRHNEFTSEIEVMGVVEKLHGQGCGRQLVEHVEGILRSRAIEFLSVKTLAPSHPDKHYERTRGFYRRLGFRPLEENSLWGGANPCLIMVKHLSCSNAPG